MKLTQEQIREMTEALANGKMSRREAADKYNISEGTVSRVFHNRARPEAGGVRSPNGASIAALRKNIRWAKAARAWSSGAGVEEVCKKAGIGYWTLGSIIKRQMGDAYVPPITLRQRQRDDQIVSLYQGGMGPTEIGRKHSLTYGGVRRILIRRGVWSPEATN